MDEPTTWPCSVQQASYLARDRGRGGAPFNSVAAFTAAAPVDATTLTRALRDIAARHPMLRAAIVGDPPSAAIHADVEVDVDTAVCATADDLRAGIGREWDARFVRASPPLWRARQHVLPDGTALLLLTFDHVVFDGLSRSIVVNELIRPVAQPAPSTTYGEFAAWQRREFADCAGEGVRFWHDLLAGVPVRRSVPLPFAPPAGVEPASVAHVVRLDEAQSARCREVAREQNVSIVVLLLAALLGTLSELSGERDVTVRVPVHGRPARFVRVVGWFANDTMCRVRHCVPGDALGTLPALAAVWSGLLRHQAVPIEVVERCVGDAGQPVAGERPRLVTFNAIGESAAAQAAPAASNPHGPALPGRAGFAALGTTLTPVGVVRDVLESGLQMGTSAATGSIALQCSFDPARYAPADVARLLGAWRGCLVRAGRNGRGP